MMNAEATANTSSAASLPPFADPRATPTCEDEAEGGPGERSCPCEGRGDGERGRAWFGRSPGDGFLGMGEGVDRRSNVATW